jgi:hypothetical protein
MIQAETTVDQDNYGPVVKFDATPWFEQATADQIEQLAAEEFFAGDTSDEVAEFCADRDATLQGFFGYVRFRQEHGSGAGGYSCRVSEADAMEWLAENRPALFRSLRGPNPPGYPGPCPEGMDWSRWLAANNVD